MSQRKFRKISAQKGQSLVEFALVLPVFIIVLFGIMEFGRLWEISNVLTSAAREGVRVAAVTAPDQALAISAAQNVLNVAQISNAQVLVSGPNASNEVSVTVTLNYQPMSGVIVPGLRNMSLTRSTTMRWEG